jgi:O-antigen ligase
VALIGGFTLLVMLLAGEAMARSRAGIGLTMVALFGAIALGFSGRRAGSGITPNKLLFAAIALALTFVLQFALYRALDRFLYDPIESGRQFYARSTIEAAKAYMPLGSGVGTFVPVYAMFEKPEGLSDAYVNHAHNDALEVWLETGALGIVLMVLFVIWLVRRSVEIWRSTPPNGASALDWSLARAATIVPALVMVHSLVDYQLRTGAMMAIMAFACALLVEPPAGPECREGLELQTVPERTRHRATRGLEPTPSPALQPPTSGPSPSTETSDAPSRSSGGQWGADIKWPEEWSKPSNSRSAGDKDEPPNSSKPPDQK